MSNFPVVRVERVDVRNESVSKIDVWARIKNESDRQVKVVSWEYLGNMRNESHTLNPGNTVDVMLYSGAPKNYPDQMYIRYEAEHDGGRHYFLARHQAKFDERYDNNTKWYRPSDWMEFQRVDRGN